jgi:uncharacterized membrane protein YphA (DoxX/SURF4 family)
MANQKNNKAIHIILWIFQALLAVMFIMAGTMKATQPIEILAEGLPWVTSTPIGLVRFIGISELLGGLGLLLPPLLRIRPFLTVWAALGLSVIMISAAIFHASKGEFSAIGVNVFILFFTLFIAWGRSRKALILPKKA